MSSPHEPPEAHHFHVVSQRNRILLGIAAGIGGGVGVAAAGIPAPASASSAWTAPANVESGLTLASSSKVRILAGRPTDFWLEGEGADAITTATFDFTRADGSTESLESDGPGSAADPAVTYTFDTVGAAVPVRVTVERDGETAVLETTLEVISLDTVSQEIEPPPSGASGANGRLVEVGGSDDPQRADDSANEGSGDSPSANGTPDNDPTGYGTGGVEQPVNDLPPLPVTGSAAASQPSDADSSTGQNNGSTSNQEAATPADPTKPSGRNDAQLATPGNQVGQQSDPQSRSAGSAPDPAEKSPTKQPPSDNGRTPADGPRVPPLVADRRRDPEIVDENGNPIEPFPGDEPETLVASSLIGEDTEVLLAANSEGSPPEESPPDEAAAELTPEQQQELDELIDSMLDGSLRDQENPKKPLTPKQKRTRDALKQLCVSGVIAACQIFGNPDVQIRKGIFTPPSPPNAEQKKRDEAANKGREGSQGQGRYGRGNRKRREGDDEGDGDGDEPNQFEQPIEEPPPNFQIPPALWEVPLVVPVFLYELLKFLWLTSEAPDDELLKNGIKIGQPQLVAALELNDLDLSDVNYSDFARSGITFDNASYTFLREQGLNFDVSYGDAAAGGIDFASAGFNELAEDFDLSNVTFSDLESQNITFTKLEDLDRELDLNGVSALDLFKAGVEGGYTLEETANTGISFDGVSPKDLDDWVRFDGARLETFHTHNFDLADTTFTELTERGADFDGLKLEDLDTHFDLDGISALEIVNAGVEGGYTLEETANTGISFDGVSPSELDDWVRFDGTNLETFDKHKFNLAGMSYQELTDRGADLNGLTYSQITDPKRGLTLSGTSFQSLADNNTDFEGMTFTELAASGVELDDTPIEAFEDAGIDTADFGDTDFSFTDDELDIDAIDTFKPDDDPFKDDPDVIGDEEDDPFYDDPDKDDPLVIGDEDDDPLYDDPDKDDSLIFGDEDDDGEDGPSPYSISDDPDTNLDLSLDGPNDPTPTTPGFDKIVNDFNPSDYSFEATKPEDVSFTELPDFDSPDSSSGPSGTGK